MPHYPITWDKIFELVGRESTEPHGDMPGLARLLKERRAETLLDLGCGSGRHLVYLARQGFSVHGLDNSPNGLSLARQWLAEEGLQANLVFQDMTEPLSYADAFFDAVVSVNVIHHAMLATIRSIVGEIFRVLKKDGLVFVSVIKLGHQEGSFEELEPNTFLPLDGPEMGLPHHFFTPEELRQVFGAFTISDIYIDQRNHYCLLASKP
jgi:cyclopropane fatty-acyl-phospholipid synthase-like methyltransferase